MLTYNRGIYKQILKPLNIKYFLPETRGGFDAPRNQREVWDFLYPAIIKNKMFIRATDVFSSMDSGTFERVPRSVREEMKIALKGTNRYVKDIHEHLEKLVRLSGEISSFVRVNGKTLEAYDNRKERLEKYVSEHEDEVAEERAQLIYRMGRILKDMETEIFSDMRIGEELRSYMQENMEKDPIKVVGILSVFALFAFDDDEEFFMDLERQYCASDEIARPTSIGLNELPHELTNTIVIGATSESVLYRDREYEEIIDDICTKERQSVVLSGMGGCGKTSVARLVYCALKEKFDCCGWINYTGDLKQSMISSLKFGEYSDETMTENDAQKKWKYIYKALSDSKQSKLLVIDNVDYIEGVQAPTLDKELVGMSSWENVRIIITSRLPEIAGYNNTHKINNLGNSEDYEKCVQVFYHYNPKAERYRDDNHEVVKNLCELAGFNTMVIELLAKGSRYDYHDLEEFYQKLKEIGFRYADEVPVETDHDYNVLFVKDEDGVVQEDYYNIGNETASSQLMKLFNLKTRKEVERQILWDFRCLPRSEKVSREELKEWLGYSLKEMDPLVAEGWVKYEEDYFFIHPLVRSTVACVEVDKEKFWKRAEERRAHETKPTMLTRVKAGTFFDKSDDFEKAIRKIRFVDRLSYGGIFLAPDTIIYIADFARKRGVRDIGLSYYKMAHDRLYDAAKEMGCMIANNPMEYLDETDLKTARDFWRSTYFYGYMLSYTKSGYDEAEKCLALACAVIRNISECLPKEESMRLSGMSLDHYGYVKSNNNKSLLNNFVNACMLYRLAIAYRKKLCEQYPDNLSYYKDLAWSLDNLGTLFAIANYDELQGEKGDESDLCLRGEGELFSYEEEYRFFMNSEDKAEKYLKDALAMRVHIAEKKGDPNSTEVAWTCCNIGSLLAKYPGRYEEAEKLLFDALNIYESLDKLYPGQHMSSTARTYTTYARLLSNWEGRREDAIAAYEKALSINSSLEQDYPGIYVKEVENIQEEMKRKFSM